MSNMAATSSAPPGEQLRLARERMGLSVERVAKDLFLDVQKIKAIESNHFKELDAPVYAKGYLKKYARLVGLTEEEVLLSYAALSDAPAAVDPVPVTLGMIPETRPLLPRWAWWTAVAVIVLAGVITLLSLHSPAPVVTQRSAVLESPLTQLAQAPVSATVSAGTLLALRFSFQGESWVEVRDAQDKVLLYDLGTNNSVREVSGQAPLRVVLGAASAVQLQVNSQAVPIPASTVQADVARFVLNAQGQLQQDPLQNK